MSIADEIEDAIDDLKRGRPDRALVHVLIAVDATTKKEGRRGDTKGRMMGFFKCNRSYTCAFLGIGGQAIKLNMKNASGKPEIRTVENILYELVRKYKLHEARLPDQVIINDGFGVTEEGKFILSPDLLRGIIFAVIGSPANSNEHSADEMTIQVFEDNVPINCLWGNTKEALKLAMADFNCRGRIPQKGRPTHG